jgi:3-hydroxyacyl-CoA dehydrogenase
LTNLTRPSLCAPTDQLSRFYAQLGQVCSKNTILASNTSSFPIEHMAVASGRPDKVVGLHFLYVGSPCVFARAPLTARLHSNPVQLMNLCEVVQGNSTSSATMEVAMEFATQVKRQPVQCKDTPGFIVNRLLVPYIAQALCMYDRKECSKESMDVAMQNGAGMPMGPLTLAVRGMCRTRETQTARTNLLRFGC